MVRGIRIDAVEDTPRPIVAVGNDYPDGHFIAPHSHRRGQFLSSATGALVLTTTEGAWVMPPQRGMWIPPRTMHQVAGVGALRMQSLYLERSVTAAMPNRCQVVGVSPFMRSLLTESLSLPLLYELEGRAGALMTLILHEMRQLPALPLSLPLPQRTDLADLCRAFLRNPKAHDTIDDWRSAIGASRRTFTRVFRDQTGLSFAAWRQQACLVAALPKLTAGESVTSVAMAFGYDNPAAFTTMFKRLLGVPPRQYLSQG